MAKVKAKKKPAAKAKKTHVLPKSKAKAMKPAKTSQKPVKKTVKTVKPSVKKTPSRHLKALKKIPMAKPLAQAAPAPKIPAFKGVKKKFYDMLMEVRRQFEKQINFHSSEALTAPGSAGDLSSNMSNHMADFGSDNFLHDMELEMMSSEVEVLEMIDEAVERLVSGEFGKCLDCGCQIPVERLDAKPYARFCVKCKTAREENNGLRPEFNR